MKRGRGATVLAAVATGALVLVPSAVAKTRVVKPGKSIQAAIDKSKPGDTVEVRKGTYREALQISKDDITLLGEKGVVLKQPATPPTTTCSQMAEKPTDVVGICIVGHVTIGAQGPTLDKQVSGVRVERIDVNGFSADGVFIFGGKKVVLKTNVLEDNGGYGAFSNTSQGTRFINNDVLSNGAPGLYVGDSPHANATIRNNYARGNAGEGILLRNASHGHVRKNILKKNCAGLLVLADAPGPARKWTIDHNASSFNNKACPGEPDDGEPAVSGIGIGLIGAQDTTLAFNGLYKNASDKPSFAHGGIVVSTGVEGTPEHNLLIKGNALDSNSPFDISWDKKGTKISFVDNKCSKSKPKSICS